MTRVKAAQDHGRGDPVGVYPLLAGPHLGGPDQGELHQLVNDE